MKMLEKSISIQESPFAEAQGILNEIYKKEYLSEVSEELITTFRHVSKNLHVREDSKYQELGMLAMDYIEKNYGDPTVSLNAVCEYLAVSPSYLSNVVKGYTGGTFIEALTKKRIEKAKNLIETTSYKNYQIAHLVGYSDPYYFSKAFKKMTGMSPTEYARKVR